LVIGVLTISNYEKPSEEPTEISEEEDQDERRKEEN
jgi:hypothetical protein